MVDNLNMTDRETQVREDEFSIIMDSSPDVIHIFDGEGNSLDINKACETVEGVSREAVLNKSIYQLLEEGIYNESVTLKVLEEKKPVTILQKTHADKEVLVTATPFFKNGKIHRVVCYSRDITELNKVKRELEEVDTKVQKYEEELKLYRAAQIDSPDFIIGSEQIKQIVLLAQRIAGMDTTVLIRGESGTGKEEICKVIHKSSLRKGGPFIKLNCGAIPEQLIESELFGYEAGAFTDASKQGKTGLIELADKGTLFLDEVGELPLSIQVKLLRVLQDGTIYRLGGQTPIKVNFRLISATNSDLEKKIKAQKLREDFYYRLNVVPVFIPPLRERRDDIKSLITHYLNKFNEVYHLSKQFKPEALNLLYGYNWPGNIRELKNIVERMVVTVQNEEIAAKDLPPKIRLELLSIDASDSDTLKERVDAFEKTILEESLTKYSGVVKTAQNLGIDRSTLFRKLKKYEIYSSLG